MSKAWRLQPNSSAREVLTGRALILMILCATFLTMHLFVPGAVQAATPATEPDRIVVQVKGAGCPFCVFGIEKWFSKIDGVDDVEMDLETGKATLTLRSGAKVTEQDLENAVKKAGFTPAAIQDITYQDSDE